MIDNLFSQIKRKAVEVADSLGIKGLLRPTSNITQVDDGQYVISDQQKQVSRLVAPEELPIQRISDAITEAKKQLFSPYYKTIGKITENPEKTLSTAAEPFLMLERAMGTLAEIFRTGSLEHIKPKPNESFGDWYSRQKLLGDVVKDYLSETPLKGTVIPSIVGFGVSLATPSGFEKKAIEGTKLAQEAETAITSRIPKKLEPQPEIKSELGQKLKEKTSQAVKIPLKESAFDINQDITEIVNKVTNLVSESLKRAKEKRPFLAQAISKERSKRAVIGAKVYKKAGGGLPGFIAEKGIMKGKLAPQFKIEPVINKIAPEELNKLIEAINRFNGLEYYEKFSAKDALLRLLNGEIIEPAEISKLEDVFGFGFVKPIVQFNNKLSLGQVIKEVPDIIRAWLATGDFSGTLRQGIIFTSSRPRLALKAFGQQIIQSFSQKKFDEWMNNLKNSETYIWAKRAGIEITDPFRGIKGKGLIHKEEAYQQTVIDKLAKLNGVKGWIPKTIKAIIGVGERGMSAYLNYLRIGVLEDFLASAKIRGLNLKESMSLDELGLDKKIFNKYINLARKYDASAFVDTLSIRLEDKEWAMLGLKRGEKEKLFDLYNKFLAADSYWFLKSVGNFINSGTGRGNLGQLNKSAYILNKLFYSVKLQKSRIDFLNPLWYIKLHPYVRMKAIRDFVTFLGAGYTILSVLHANGADVGVNPFSSDFGKVVDRKSGFRWDIWGGFQQWAVLLARLATLKYTTINGKEISLNDKVYGSKRRSDLLIRFMRSKLAPFWGKLWDVIDESDFAGQPITLKKTFKNLMLMMWVQDLIDAMDYYGVEGFFNIGIPSFFGLGVSRIPSREQDDYIQKRLREILGGGESVVNGEEDFIKKYLERESLSSNSGEEQNKSFYDIIWNKANK